MLGENLITGMLSSVKKIKYLFTNDVFSDDFVKYMIERKGIPYNRSLCEIENSLNEIIRHESQFIAIEEELYRIRIEKNELNEKLNEAISKLKQIQESLNKI